MADQLGSDQKQLEANLALLQLDGVDVDVLRNMIVGTPSREGELGVAEDSQTGDFSGMSFISNGNEVSVTGGKADVSGISGEISLQGYQYGRAVPDSVADNAYGWYDASKITANDQDSISTWPDKSDLGNDLSGSAIYHSEQINGEPAVYFDGSHLLSTSDSTGYPLTWFVVHKTDGTTSENEQGIIGNGGGVANIDNLQHRTSDDTWVATFSGSSASGGNPDQNWHVSTFKNDGSGGFVRVDSTQIFTHSAGTNDSPESITIGDKKDSSDRPFLGYVAEAIFVNEDVSAEDISDTEQLLADTYGISLS